MVALVTGAAGFIGRHAAERLALGGWKVVGAGRPEVELPSPEFDSLLRDTAPELVVHCAGPASVPASVNDPAADRTGAVDVVDALLESVTSLPRTPRVILISSAAVYGDPAELPVREDHPLRPVSPYGEHRAAAEQLVHERCASGQLRGAVLRVFSAYGVGLRRQLLWDICLKAARAPVVELAGTGDESRDFVHVEDVARAIAATARRADFTGEIYNVASGQATTVREVAELLLAGTDAQACFTGVRRPGDPLHWRADVTRLASLGHVPRVAFVDGARAFATWARRVLPADVSKAS